MTITGADSVVYGQTLTLTTTGGTGSGDKVTSSNTGDSSQMTRWIGTVILSGAAITLLLQKKKRQSR